MCVGLVATITTDYIDMVKVCREHLQRQLAIEPGAIRCEMFVSGNNFGYDTILPRPECNYLFLNNLYINKS